MSNSSVIVICSRLNSSRVNQKALRSIAGYNPIQHILHRLSNSKNYVPIIVAIPDSDENEKRVYEGITKNFPMTYLFCGNPDSPLHRMVDAIGWYSNKIKETSEKQ